MRKELHFGLPLCIIPTLLPVIIWSILAYFVPVLANNFMMGFFGTLSLAGVHFLNILFSYSDDFVMMRVLDFYTFLFWVYSDYDLSVGLWEVFPTYLKSFVVKTLANIWMIFIAIKYYDGWREHGKKK